MGFWIVIVFILGYTAIALEHPLKINKTATAITTGVLCWTLFMLSTPSEELLSSDHYQSFLGQAPAGHAHTMFQEYVIHSLGNHLNEISQILFFLLGAMTIVELIDAHGGFDIIKGKIKTRSTKKLLWIVCWATFFLSAVLDNLTSSIVMVSLLRKLIPDKDMRLFFAGMIIIAANAGGAWTPIGDVTTTMLWIGGQISAVGIMKMLFLPSVVCLLVPLLYLSITLKGTIGNARSETEEHIMSTGRGKLMLSLGLIVLIAIPAFKMLTNLPPYLGMLGGLGLLWIVSEFVNPEADATLREKYTPLAALTRIDMPSILFFLGILLAVAALESMTMLQSAAEYLGSTIGDERIIVSIIGLLSAVVDNVPLVAASMGMYNIDHYPTNALLWEYLAYCAGTGGSLLIIGSAAGVAVMGIEKIDFVWYLKRISLIALMGYIGGAATYLLMQSLS